MRVLFVSESTWMLGPVYDLHMLAEGLVERGHTVFAVDPGEWTDVATGSEPRVQKAARYISTAEVTLVSPRFVHAPTRLPLWGWSWVKSQYDRFRARYRTLQHLLMRERFDVLVLYSAARMGLITVLLARKYGIPIVFRNVDMLHKLWAHKRDQFIVCQLEKLVYRSVDRICALTPRYAEYMRNLGANPNITELVLFPIETTRFNPSVPNEHLRKKWNIQDGEKIVLFMGTLYPFGGVKLFVESIDLLITRVPKVRLLIVGDGVIRQELIDFVNNKNIGEHVTITGHEPFELMPSYITLADVCLNVFPSNKKTADIFSAKIVQYLACGRPTVSSALPGITTVIPGEGAGVVYCRTIQETIEETAKLLLDKAKCIEMGRSGVEFSTNSFGFSKVLVTFESVVRKLVQSKAVS